MNVMNVVIEDKRTYMVKFFCKVDGYSWTRQYTHGFWILNKKLKSMKKIEKYLLGFHINDKFPH